MMVYDKKFFEKMMVYNDKFYQMLYGAPLSLWSTVRQALFHGLTGYLHGSHDLGAQRLEVRNEEAQRVSIQLCSSPGPGDPWTSSI